MIENVIIEFQKVTKYPIVEYLTTYEKFMSESYPIIDSYFSGKIDTIDNSHLILLKKIILESENVLTQFKNFANKFENCGYWEFLEFIEDLDINIEKINKLPKFKRTSLTKRGYQPYIQIAGDLGGMSTVEDLADKVRERNDDNTDWIDLMLSNDLNEKDWEIDKLSKINVMINSQTDILVTTILDQPIGERIYGKDINRRITFENNDLSIKEYLDNVDQKVNILLNLSSGDIPENKFLGKRSELIIGNTRNNFLLPVLAEDLRNTFLQNDLFEYIQIVDVFFDNGDFTINCEIKTKYDYKTVKQIRI